MTTRRRALRHVSIAPILMTGALLVLNCQMLVAQMERSNVQGMGMARTALLSSRGLDAVGINPANLAYSEGKTVTFSLFPFGVHLGSNFMDYDLYTTYFTGVDSDSGRVGKFLTDADKQKILDAFPRGVGTLFTNFEIRLFGLSIEIPKLGTFAFTVSEHANAFANIPKDYAEFVLYGNPPGSFRDFSETDAKASWTREYELSFGMPLQRLMFTKTLEAGIGLKLIHGFGYFGIDRFNTSVETSPTGTLTGILHFGSLASGVDFMQDNNKNSGGNFDPFPAPAGVGYAVDLGVSSHVTDCIYAGLSLTDLGSMQWTRNAEEVTADTVMVVDDPVGTGQKDAVDRTVKGNKRKVDSFYSTLPTQLRLGVALQVDKWPGNEGFPGELLVELDYTQGFKDTPGSTTAARFSLGVEYLPLSWLPIRTGVSVGGIDRFNLAFGLGFHFGSFTMDLGSENVTALLAPRSFSSASIALGMKLLF